MSSRKHGGLNRDGNKSSSRGHGKPKGRRAPLTEYQNGRTVDAQLLKRQGFAPSTIVTDKLGSYGAAKKRFGLHAVHEQGLRQNNRRENSHLPVRRRKHKQQRFKSPGSAQRFLNIHAAVYNLFNIDRHLTSQRTMKEFRGQAFRRWRALTAAA